MAATNTNPLDLSKARLADLQDAISQRVDALKHGADIAIGTTRDASLGLTYSTSAAAIDRAAKVTRALPLGKPLADLLQQQATALTDRELQLQMPNIPDYDTLNVREVTEALQELGPWELSKVRRYEAAHKKRKTVLGALDRLLGAGEARA